MALCPELQTISLFSGYGGLDLGVWLATGGAARTVLYVEKESTSAAFLAARMADGTLAEAPIWSNVRTLDARAWCGRVDLVTASPPCQPFSLAGKQRGRKDERWLGQEVLRIVRQCGARALFIENVPAFASAGLPTIIQAVEAWGWRWEAINLAAEDAGASHRRTRLWFLAVADVDGARCKGQRSNGLFDGQWKARWDDADGCRGEELANTQCQGLEEWTSESRDARQKRTTTQRGRGVAWGSYFPPPREIRFYRGGRVSPRFWPNEPTAAAAKLGRVADGPPAWLDRSDDVAWPHRIRAVGDGVCPLAAALSWRILTTRLREEKT